MNLGATHKATVIGFSRLNCERCFGRGRAGWIKQENGTVIPCSCVEFFDLEAIREDAEQAKAEQAKSSQE